MLYLGQQIEKPVGRGFAYDRDVSNYEDFLEELKFPLNDTIAIFEFNNEIPYFFNDTKLYFFNTLNNEFIKTEDEIVISFEEYKIVMLDESVDLENFVKENFGGLQ